MNQLPDMLDNPFIIKMLKEAVIGFRIQELNKWEVVWGNDKLSEILNMEQSEIIGHDIRVFFNKEGQVFLTSFRDYNPKIIVTKGNFDIDT